MLKVENEKKLRQIVHLKKELHTIKKKKENNSTTDTTFYQYGNQVSILKL